MPHVGDIFSADEAVLAGLLHLKAAEAGEGDSGQGYAQRVDELRAVVIAGGFTCG